MYRCVPLYTISCRSDALNLKSRIIVYRHLPSVVAAGCCIGCCTPAALACYNAEEHKKACDAANVQAAAFAVIARGKLKHTMRPVTRVRPTLSLKFRSTVCIVIPLLV